MKPVPFDGCNTVFAKNQPEYQPLPAHFSTYDGRVTSCWQLALKERLRILFTGRLWLQQMSFGEPLQPQLPSAERPILKEMETVPVPSPAMSEAHKAQETKR